MHTWILLVLHALDDFMIGLPFYLSLLLTLAVA